MGVESVGHKLELSVGRNEGDGSVILEARQTDTLVKLDVLQLHRFTLSTFIRGVGVKHTVRQKWKKLLMELKKFCFILNI